MRRPAVGEASDGLVPGEPGLLRGGQVEGRHGEAVRRSARFSKEGLNSGPNYLLRVETLNGERANKLTASCPKCAFFVCRRRNEDGKAELAAL